MNIYLASFLSLYFLTHSCSQSSVKDYIGYFEPLVVSVVKHFPQTSSILLQQRILFLLVQLLQLKVSPPPPFPATLPNLST